MIRGEKFFIDDTPFGNAGCSEILSDFVKDKTNSAIESEQV